MTAFKYTSKTLPKHTSLYEVEIEWDAIVQKRESVFDQMAKDVRAPGFRQGKAPREVASRHIDPRAVYEQVVRELLPTIYQEIIDKEKLNPVTQPAVELTQAKDNEPWKLTLTVAQVPPVTLGDYKAHVRKLREKAKGTAPSQIDIPSPKPKTRPKSKKHAQSASPDTTPPHEHEGHSHDSQPTMSQIFTTLLEHVTCDIPDMLINQDVDRKLSQLVDDVRKVGLSLEKYLESRSATLDDLKKRYAKESEEMYKLEFILAKISEDEGLIADQGELDKILSQAKTEREREIALGNMDWYKALLRKQKALDFLNSL